MTARAASGTTANPDAPTSARRAGTIGPARQACASAKVTKPEHGLNATALIRTRVRRELLLRSVEVVSAAER
jgi:hypothetical protein